MYGLLYDMTCDVTYFTPSKDILFMYRYSLLFNPSGILWIIYILFLNKHIFTHQGFRRWRSSEILVILQHWASGYMSSFWDTLWTWKPDGKHGWIKPLFWDGAGPLTCMTLSCPACSVFPSRPRKPNSRAKTTRSVVVPIYFVLSKLSTSVWPWVVYQLQELWVGQPRHVPIFY